MPPPVVDDDHKRRARRRLIGAVALTIIAVITLPLVLDKEPPPVGSLEIHMPALPAQSQQTVVQSATAQNPVGNAGVVPSTIEYAPPAENTRVDTSASVPTVTPRMEPVIAPATKEQTPKPPMPKEAQLKADPAKAQSTKVESAKVDSPRAEPSKTLAAQAMPELKLGKSEPQPAQSSPATEGVFSVQIGVFADKANVEKLKTRIAALGLNASTEAVGDSTRVRVGKFSSREQAEVVVKKLKAAGLSAKVVEK